MFYTDELPSRDSNSALNLPEVNQPSKEDSTRLTNSAVPISFPEAGIGVTPGKIDRAFANSAYSSTNETIARRISARSAVSLGEDHSCCRLNVAGRGVHIVDYLTQSKMLHVLVPIPCFIPIDNFRQREIDIPCWAPIKLKLCLSAI